MNHTERRKGISFRKKACIVAAILLLLGSAFVVNGVSKKAASAGEVVQQEVQMQQQEQSQSQKPVQEQLGENVENVVEPQQTINTSEDIERRQDDDTPAEVLPSKRAVLPGEVVPQEDAVMEEGAALAAAAGPTDVQEGAETPQVRESEEMQSQFGESPAGIVEHVFEVPDTGAGALSDADTEETIKLLDRDLRTYAAIRIVENNVWLKFAQGKSFLPDGTATLLNNLLPISADKYLVVATYSDPGLSLRENEALAQERALAVKKILQSLKVSEERIVLLKPQTIEDDHVFAFPSDRVVLRVEEGNRYTSDDVMHIRQE